MGTSRTNDGPGDRIPLLPAWALGGEPEILPDAAPGDEVVVPDGGEDAVGDEASPPDVADVSDTGQRGETGDGTPRTDEATGPSNQPPSGRWQAAKRRLTQSARASGGRTSVSAAGRAYVRAKGGPRSAAVAATHGRATATRVGRFLGALRSGGIRAALDTLGLRNFVGRAADVVFAAIANALAPAGSTLEAAAARRAADEVLSKLYDDVIEAGGALTALEAMSLEDVADAVRGVIVAYVYERWLEQLGKSIESGAVTATEAVRLEQEVKQYVRDVVTLEVTNQDVLAFGGDEARTQGVIDRLYEEAYSLLEDGQ